jgi:Domain of unknown function (DUF397)
VNRPEFDSARWRKSSHSGQNGTCVEVAALGSLVGVRDSKSIRTGQLTLAASEWRCLINAAKADLFVQ